MTLTTKNRTALFEAFAPLAGEEATEAMLAEFPATENDELVTKQFLRAELAEVRIEFADLRTEFADLRTEFADLRGEVKGDIADLRGEVKGDIAALSDEIHARFRSQTQWMMGTMIGLFGTMIATGGLLVAFSS